MRGRKMRLFLVLLGFFLCWETSLFAQQQLRVDRYFPDSTQIFISVSDVKNLGEHWRQTQLSETLSDPKFQPFRESLKAQIEKAWPDRLGLNFDDIANLPTGEIGVGLIAEPGKKPGFAVMMNVDGNASAVNEFLVRLIRQTTNKETGVATKERLTAGTQAVDATVVTFPVDETHPTARQAYYVALPKALIATDQKYLAETLVSRLSGEKTNSLFAREEYRAILNRCLNDSATKATPQIRFFANPLAAGEALRSLASPEPSNSPSPFDVLAKEGFDGIKGVGGTVDFAVEGKEVVYRTKVYIPKPATRSLKMLSFENVDSLQPPTWVG
ncbi:MAG: hypothetical protein IJM30_02055, partial [Thermoguttaceae bacterium]|nr:hypothetical protein [Thermoguttaceae bacterium]